MPGLCLNICYFFKMSGSQTDLNRVTDNQGVIWKGLFETSNQSWFRQLYDPFDQEANIYTF